MTITIGTINTLTIQEIEYEGAYLTALDSQEDVFLAKEELNDTHKVGDTLDVFVFQEKDNLSATLKKTHRSIR
jgi:predicted RNA-binding protein (virulence factor B family)